MEVTISEHAVRELKALHAQLKIAQAAILVAAAALHHQNADHDEEIAQVLEYCASAPLYEQIETLKAMIANSARSSRHERRP